MAIEIKEIINKLNSKNDEEQDDIINISRGYKLLLNYLKSNILEGENLIIISNLIIKHLNKDNNEIIIIKLLECCNYLIDFLNIEESEQQSIILNQLIEILLSSKLIGNNNLIDDKELQNEIISNVSSIISSIIKSFKFQLILKNLEYSLQLVNNNNSNSNNVDSSDHLLIENHLKIICFLIESSIIQSIELKSIFKIIVSLLKYPNCQFYPSLYKSITLIINDIGNQFLEEIDFDNNKDQSIKKIILKLLEYDQEKKKKQIKQPQIPQHHDSSIDSMDCSNDNSSIINNKNINNNNNYNNENEDDWENTSSNNISVNSIKSNNTSLIKNNNNNNNNNKLISSNSSTSSNSGISNNNININIIKPARVLNNYKIQQKQDDEDRFSQLSKRKPLGIQLLCENLNEQEFEFRMNEIIEVLDNSESEWNIKLNNVLKFQSLIKSGACKLSNFIPIFSRIKDLLITQVLDKRSILMKEACLTVSSIAEQLEHQFEPYFERFFDALLKCIIVSTKVVSESSDNCIKCILASVKSCKIIPRINELLENDKSAIVRSKCAEYLLILLQETPLQQLEKYFDLIEKSIRIGIQDAQPTARSFSRQSYFQYSINWPSKSIQLFNTLDSNSQKAIQKEQQPSSSIPSSTTSKTVTGGIKKPSLTSLTSKKLITPPISNSTSTSTSNNLLKISPFVIKPIIASNNTTETFQIGSKPTTSSGVVKKSSLPSSLKKNNNSPNVHLLKPISTTKTSATKTTTTTTTNTLPLPTLNLTPTPFLNQIFQQQQQQQQQQSQKRPISSISTSPSKILINNDKEKKRSISNIFTEVSSNNMNNNNNNSSNNTRKKQMLSHPTSPSFKNLNKNYKFTGSIDHNDDDYDNNFLKNSLGSPKKVLIQDDHHHHTNKLNFLGSPKKVSTIISSSPKKTKSSVSTLTSTTTTTTTTSSSLPLKPIIISNNTTTASKPISKINSTTTTTKPRLPIRNAIPLKNYVKDIMTSTQQQQRKTNKELKLTDLYN